MLNNYTDILSLPVVYMNANFDISEMLIPNSVSTFAMGSVDYLYETSSALLSGGLIRYDTGESLSSLISWPELITLSSSLNLMGSNYISEAVPSSVLLSGYSSAMQLSCDLPVAVVLNNPEIVSLAGPNLSLFNDMYCISSSLLRSDFVLLSSSTYINLISYLTVILSIYLFILLYFYTNNKLNTSESSSDNDYLSIWALTESEKELGSADDLVLLIIVITYIFGWFFGSNFYFIISRLPEFLTFIYSIPGIFYVVFSTPTYLLFDYGLFYGTYLRGASLSSFFLYEFGYDIIMICVFYIRLALQAIRLVLMAIACASYYDYIMFYNYKNCMLIQQPTTLMEVSNVFNLTVFWFLIKVPGTLLYLAYEVLHLWFILISQTLSFFAMIFWLFLYLYSFFLIVTVEGFFRSRRELRYNLIYARLNVKQSV